MKFRDFLTFIILIIIILVPTLFLLYGDFLWFSSVLYENVFLTILFTDIFMGIVFALVFMGFAYLNAWVSVRHSKKKGTKHKKNTPITVFILLVAILLGYTFANWNAYLGYMNSTPFNLQDPVFGLDISFYVFQLPFLDLIINYLIALLAFTTIFTVATYSYHSFSVSKTTVDAFEEGAPSYSLNFRGLIKKITPHLSFLVGLLFFVLAYKLVLAQYGLLFSFTGTSFGAGFTDIFVFLPLLRILSIIAVIIGILFLANLKLKKFRLLKLGIYAFIGIAIIGSIIGGVNQTFIVQPDEANLESPYIERTINHTLNAYGLDQVQESIFPVVYNLSENEIRNNDGTINNIRLWDYRPLITTYNQLQLFRTYYGFSDVDIDRYTLHNQFKQVMVAARELNLDNLPASADTWVNNHLVYTHGYGAVMSPVDSVSGEGLPELFVKDIPPQSEFLDLDRPEIYYGEQNKNYAIVGTTTDELDYPSGDENIYTTYAGKGGVPISDFLTRLVYAFKFGSIEFLVSGSITPESKVLLNRNVDERADIIAPFLIYDGDPYIVISGGKLFWILDAYTFSDRYPYSKPVFMSNGAGFNYIRNSVKVVIDAYSGDITFYVIDETDPIIQTYQKIFPSLFTKISEMPSDLKDHIRYPEGLFRIQAELYSTFHMKDPKVFYNKEDVWVQPEEIYRGNVQDLEPYYIIMKLPEERNEEFVLIQPFTPKNKQNMIAWMAARSDSPNYGELVVYRFSKQELIYGPLQIEARIDQDTRISQLFTLWGQSGSSVTRGNTLVIPIENSILYIEPVFLEATEKGTLPQFKRVIVAYGNKLTMQNTLEEALNVIFDAKFESVQTETSDEPEDILKQIADLYDTAQEALQQGDIGEYGRLVDKIGELVESF